jgi:hypothetical protein
MITKKAQLPRILVKDPSHQFGSKAPEKLSRLLFMIRENQDVFDVFVNKLPELVIANREADLADPIVNFMFNDLVSPHLNKRLYYISYQVAMSEVPHLDKLDEATLKDHSSCLEQFKVTFFNELLHTLEARQCAQSMFV